MVLLASTDWSTASLVVIAFLVGVILLGSLWSAHREIYIRDQEKRSHTALNEVMLAYNKVTANAEVITLRLAELATCSKEMKSEMIAVVKERADDQKELVQQLEVRLREAIHLIDNHRASAGANINFNAAAQGTQIGDGNNQR